jgi:hypothetical protein
MDVRTSDDWTAKTTHSNNDAKSGFVTTNIERKHHKSAHSSRGFCESNSKIKTFRTTTGRVLETGLHEANFVFKVVEHGF